MPRRPRIGSGSRKRAARPLSARRPPDGFLYVEGAGDRAIVEGWARSLSPRFERAARAATIILGGKQPARARAHLLRERERNPALRGLCILDRDALDEDHPAPLDGLEIFTWSRRHIESYLLDPAAIRRALRRRDHDGTLERFLRDEFPAHDDEAAFRRLHAKKLLAPRGPLALDLGRPIPLGRVARAMRPEDYHPDVRQFLQRLTALLGHSPPAPVVTLRRPSR